MKLNLKTVDNNSYTSFLVERLKTPCWDGNWHYHEEYELIYLLKGQGIRLVGDNISYFKAGELVIIGPWLPHLWRNGDEDSEPNSVDRIIVKFKSSFLGQNFFSIPEMGLVSNLLERSFTGLQFGEKTRKIVHPLLNRLLNCTDYNRIITLFQILGALSESDDFITLSNPEFKYKTQIPVDSRLSKVLSYISDNYQKDLSLDELASISAITPNSFCRFFKEKTNKTLIHFINEVRVGKACQLLINGNEKILSICYESGFNSMTSFNRVFKSLTNQSPKEYREKFAHFNSHYFKTL